MEYFPSSIFNHRIRNQNWYMFSDFSCSVLRTWITPWGSWTRVFSLFEVNLQMPFQNYLRNGGQRILPLKKILSHLDVFVTIILRHSVRSLVSRLSTKPLTLSTSWTSESEINYQSVPQLKFIKHSIYLYIFFILSE